MKLMGFLLASLLLISTASADEPRKIALLIGVSDYESRKVDDLQYAENDIRVVGSQLKLMGFDVDVISGDQATRENTISSIDSFMEKASELESSDIVFVMFSGHGQQIPVRQDAANGSTINEVPYFCPVDSLHFDESKMSTRGKSESDIAEELNFVSLNRVLRGLDENSNSLNNLLVVDACRNNPSKGKSAGISGTSATVPRGVNIIFAAGSGQKSWESASKETEHGVFTHFLIKGLQGDAKNRRDQVTWSRLASYLQDEVAFSGPALAGAETRVQNPHSIINSTNLIVLGKATSDELIEDRLYESLRNPADVFDIAELCQEKEFIVTPVYTAMLLANEKDRARGWEILKPHFDSPDLISLVLDPLSEFSARSESRKQLGSLAPAIGYSLAELSDKQLTSSPENALLSFATKLSKVHHGYLFKGRNDSVTEDQLASLDKQQELIHEKWHQISTAIESKESEVVVEKLKAALESLKSKGTQTKAKVELAKKRKAFIGKPLPTVSGKDLEGNPISSDDFKGKVLIVDLWAFW